MLEILVEFLIKDNVYWVRVHVEVLNQVGQEIANSRLTTIVFIAYPFRIVDKNLNDQLRNTASEIKEGAHDDHLVGATFRVTTLSEFLLSLDFLSPTVRTGHGP